MVKCLRFSNTNNQKLSLVFLLCDCKLCSWLNVLLYMAEYSIFRFAVDVVFSWALCTKFGLEMQLWLCFFAVLNVSFTTGSCLFLSVVSVFLPLVYSCYFWWIYTQCLKKQATFCSNSTKMRLPKTTVIYVKVSSRCYQNRPMFHGAFQKINVA